MSEDQIVELLAQVTAYLPTWGWGIVLVLAVLSWVASKYMTQPDDTSSTVYRVLYAVATALPSLVRKVVKRREETTASSDGKQ